MSPTSALSHGDLDPHLTRGYLDPHESAPKRHLDWFSHFCTAHPCDQHTERQMHKPRYMQHLQQWAVSMHCMQAMRPSNNNYLCLIIRRWVNLYGQGVADSGRMEERADVWAAKPKSCRVRFCLVIIITVQ